MHSYFTHLKPHSLAIYLFHGVIDAPTFEVRNYTKKHADAAYFETFITELNRRGTPLAMDEVLSHLTEGLPFPDNAFAITFDDGFENNASIASPILEKHEIPATFYVTTNYVDNQIMSWIDIIELCLEHCPEASLSLPWGEFAFSNAEGKIRLLEEIRKNMKNDRSFSDPYGLASDIMRQCGLTEMPRRDDCLDKKLSWEQVRLLNKHPLFTVGGHSHMHPILTFLEPDDLETEISTSLRLLKDKAGVGPRHYSYPEGMPHCYDDTVIRTLKKHGVTCCPTAIAGSNSHNASPFHLKRIMVG